MADETTQAPTQAGQAPAPVQQNVPQPVSVIRPPATAEQARPAPPGTEDPRARAAALRREAAQIEASLGGPATVNVKVGPPHAELHFGGMFVGTEFVPVPAGRLASLQQAANDAGVTLITEV